MLPDAIKLSAVDGVKSSIIFSVEEPVPANNCIVCADIVLKADGTSSTSYPETTILDLVPFTFVSTYVFTARSVTRAVSEAEAKPVSLEIVVTRTPLDKDNAPLYWDISLKADPSNIQVTTSPADIVFAGSGLLKKSKITVCCNPFIESVGFVVLFLSATNHTSIFCVYLVGTYAVPKGAKA